MPSDCRSNLPTIPGNDCPPSRGTCILKEHETGVSIADLCRKHGASDATVYKWKAKFGGMDACEAKRLKSLEDENAKLERLLADMN